MCGALHAESRDAARPRPDGGRAPSRLDGLRRGTGHHCGRLPPDAPDGPTPRRGPGDALGDIDATWWTIPAECATNGRSHRGTAESAGARGTRTVTEADGRALVFQSPTHGRTDRQPAEGRATAPGANPGGDLRLHDLRRTAGSLMTGMGISRLTVKKILNHAQRDVTAVYDPPLVRSGEADSLGSLGPTDRADRVR